MVSVTFTITVTVLQGKGLRLLQKDVDVELRGDDWREVSREQGAGLGGGGMQGPRRAHRLCVCVVFTLNLLVFALNRMVFADEPPILLLANLTKSNSNLIQVTGLQLCS